MSSIRICAKCGRKMCDRYGRNISFELADALAEKCPNLDVSVSECLDVCEKKYVAVGFMKSGKIECLAEVHASDQVDDMVKESLELLNMVA